MKKILKTCFKLIVTIILILFAITIYREYFQPKLTDNKQERFETTAKLSGKTLKSSLNDMGFLITAEYSYTPMQKLTKKADRFSK